MPIKQTDGDHHDFRHRRRTRTGYCCRRKTCARASTKSEGATWRMTAREFAFSASRSPRGSTKDKRSPARNLAVRDDREAGAGPPRWLEESSIDARQYLGHTKYDPHRHAVLLVASRALATMCLLHRLRAERYFAFSENAYVGTNIPQLSFRLGKSSLCVRRATPWQARTAN